MAALPAHAIGRIDAVRSGSAARASAQRRVGGTTVRGAVVVQKTSAAERAVTADGVIETDTRLALRVSAAIVIIFPCDTEDAAAISSVAIAVHPTHGT